MSGRTSWKRVAERLAARLVNHAFCETHRTDEPDPACPFCADIEAYLAYVNAGGRDFRPSYNGRSVTLHELARRDAENMEER